MVNLALQVFDPVEDLDQSLVFPALVSAVGSNKRVPGRQGSILGRLGLSVVALEAELLARAALGPLFVASLLTATASITGLRESDTDGRRGRGSGKGSRAAQTALTCAAIAPLSFLRLADAEAAEGLSVELAREGGKVWVVGVMGRSFIFRGVGLPARWAALRLLAANPRFSSTDVRLCLLVPPVTWTRAAVGRVAGTGATGYLVCSRPCPRVGQDITDQDTRQAFPTRETGPHPKEEQTRDRAGATPCVSRRSAAA